MAATMEEILYMVEVDSRRSGSANFSSYKESHCSASFFQDQIVNRGNTICCESQVANLCGRNIKLYFTKYKPSLVQHYHHGGVKGLTIAMSNIGSILAKNNGAASFLMIDIDTGLTEYFVCSRAYVVEDDGHTPLSWGQVWGLQEMINCAMDIYDMEQENMARGRQTIHRWVAT